MIGYIDYQITGRLCPAMSLKNDFGMFLNKKVPDYSDTMHFNFFSIIHPIRMYLVCSFG